jgi:broad specificity phosphatase PhoE
MPLTQCDLLLVRHGVTDWNETGRVMGRSAVGLNARGLIEAEALAAALRDVPVRAVVASPQRRAQETAAVIARVQSVAVHTDPDLAEVWVGSWQGRTWEELRGDAEVQRYLRDAAYVCDAVEPAATVRARVVAATERQRAACGDGRLLLVSHGDPIRILLAHYLGLEAAAYRRLLVSPGSVSVLRFSAPPACRLVLLNWKPAAALAQLLA